MNLQVMYRVVSSINLLKQFMLVCEHLYRITIKYIYYYYYFIIKDTCIALILV
jgi:hypothetical protein